MAHKKKKKESSWSTIVNEIYGTLTPTDMQIVKNRMRSKSRSYIKRNKTRIRQSSFQDFLTKNKETSFNNAKIDPDEYFKEIICSRMGIDINWLQEKDANKRFRINMIEKIQQSEIKSLKAKHIMTDFLNTKRRDKSGIVLATGEKEIENTVRNDIFLKAIRLRSQVITRKNKSMSRTHYNIKSKNITNDYTAADNSVKELYGGILKDRKKETFSRRQLASTAENLQRDIAKLENAISGIRSGYLPTRKRVQSLKSPSREHRRERSLVKSILAKAREVKGINIERFNHIEGSPYKK